MSKCVRLSFSYHCLLTFEFQDIIYTKIQLESIIQSLGHADLRKYDNIAYGEALKRVNALEGELQGLQFVPMLLHLILSFNIPQGRLQFTVAEDPCL